MKNLNIHLQQVFFLSSFFFCLLTNAQQLESLINDGLANNPQIQALQFNYQVEAEKVNEANTLPNTEFSAGYFVSEPETRTGAQVFKLSAKQMLPSFGTISAKENYANANAEAVMLDIETAKRKLILNISTSYYNLYALQAKQNVLLENIKLLETYETMALTSVEVGKASVVDVLRLQIRQNELSENLDVIQQDFISEQANLSRLLNKELNTPITIDSSLDIPETEKLIAEEQIQLNPELTKYDKLYESVSQLELLNQKEKNPMLGFGLDYINVAERPDMSFSDNGKDIIMPMVSVSIPLFNNSFKSKTLQNKLRQQNLTAQKNDRYNELLALLKQSESSRNSAKIQYKTLKQNLKQAKDAETILIRSYETGTIDFNDVLDLQELQLKFQMNQIETIKNYYIQTLIINYLTN